MKIPAICRIIPVVLITTMGLSACVTNQTGPKEQLGGLLGAAAGGYFGSTLGKGDGRLAATAAGAVIGGVIGSDLGRTADQVDRAQVQVRRQPGHVVYPVHPAKKKKAKSRGRSIPPLHKDYDRDYDDYDADDDYGDWPY